MGIVISVLVAYGLYINRFKEEFDKEAVGKVSTFVIAVTILAAALTAVKA